MNATARHAAPATVDAGALAVAITEVTGHLSGTFEHERCLQRVQGALESGEFALVRDDARAVSTLFTPEQFPMRGGA